MSKMTTEDLTDAVLHPLPGQVNFTVRSGEASGEECSWCGDEIAEGEGTRVSVETSPGVMAEVLVHKEPCLEAMKEATPF